MKQRPNGFSPPGSIPLWGTGWTARTLPIKLSADVIKEYSDERWITATWDCCCGKTANTNLDVSNDKWQ